MIELYIAISFFFMHIGLGRKISIPYAIALGANEYFVLMLAIVLDLIQIPVFSHLYAHTSRIGLVNRIKERIERRSENMEDSKMVNWAKKLGKIGTIALTAMPFQGGGMWSGVLLASILKLQRWQKYVLLSMGSALGCSIMAFGTSAVISLF